MQIPKIRNAGLRSVLAIGVLLLIAVIFQFQNCAPPGNSNAFVLGSAKQPSTVGTSSTSGPTTQVPGTNPSPTPSAESAGAIGLSASTIAPSSAITATSAITSSNETISCSWSVLSGATVISTQTSTAVANSTGGDCSITFNAPATAGNYTLELTATNGLSQTASNSVGFTVTPPAVVLAMTAELTPTPTSGYTSTTFGFTATVTANEPEIFNVVIGTVSGGVKTPLAGCSFTSTAASTTYTPTCSIVFGAVETLALYLDVTAAGQTLDCEADSTYCTGTYAVTVMQRIIIPPCFVAGTPIETPQGQVAIEKLKVGDKVYSFDIQSGKTVVGEIGKLFVHKNRQYGVVELEDGTKLSVTPQHRFYLPKTKKWRAIGKLKVGDFLLRGRDDKAAPVAIKSLDFSNKDQKADVYNFHVKIYKNYYADDVLVHNMKVQP